MEFFKIKRDIPFMRHALILNVISAVTFLAAVFFLVTKNLNFSVEFTGGTVMELHYPKAADQEKIRNTLRGMGYSHPEVASFGTAQDIMLRLPIVEGAPAASSSTAVFNAICRDEQGTSKQTQTTTDKGDVLNRTSCVAPGGQELLGLAQRVKHALRGVRGSHALFHRQADHHVARRVEAGHARLFIAHLDQGLANAFQVGRFRVLDLHHRAALEFDRQVQALVHQEEHGSHKCQGRNHVENQRMAHEGNIFFDPEKFHEIL